MQQDPKLVVLVVRRVASDRHWCCNDDFLGRAKGLGVGDDGAPGYARLVVVGHSGSVGCSHFSFYVFFLKKNLFI